MQEVLHLLWKLLFAFQVVLVFYLLQPFLLILILALRKMVGLDLKKEPESLPVKQFQFGIVITAHQETLFIPPIVDSLLKQSYPHFNVYVIADDCDISNLHYEDPRIHILKPPEAFNTNSKSIAFGVNHFRDSDEILVIFDPDNLVHPKFLETLNVYYNKGYKAVQGNLYSKNIQGTYAKIDTVGVVFNSFMERDARSALGLSVSLWGCGVSVDVNIYRKIAYDNRSLMGGFDKRMQSEIVKNIPVTGYAKDAIVYDEKVIDAKNFEKQRIRWINSYFRFLGESLNLLVTGLRRRNLNLIYFGINLVRPPYFILILLALFFLDLNFYFSPLLLKIWLVALIIFFSSLIGIICARSVHKSVTKAIWYMPFFFLLQIKSFLRLNANKKSILKTGHSEVIYIDEILKNEPS